MVGYSYRYDQLNRLTASNYKVLGAFQLDFSEPGFAFWNNTSITPAYQERISYDGNGNIKTYLRNGDAAVAGIQMDDLTYQYERNSSGRLLSNKLRYVGDEIRGNAYTEDIKTQTQQARQQITAENSSSQSSDNYRYDKIGNLVKDNSENINRINWNVYGKISNIYKTDNSIISYLYDASGNRIVKLVQSNPGGNTYYVRDAQGNVLAVYKSTNDGGNLKWAEQHLYGSSRIGMVKTEIEHVSNEYNPANDIVSNGILGLRTYELSNHLGNVLSTISDKKIGVNDGNGGIDHYIAEVLSQNDYYPFGMQMPGRKYAANGSYRYGFNGKENDNEVKGEGNQQDYGMRIYDPRLGKFLSVDPIARQYPRYSPYHFAGNNPIRNLDLDGLEPSPYELHRARQKTNEMYANAKTPEERAYVEKMDKRGQLIAGGMLGAGLVAGGATAYGGVVITTFLRVATSPGIIATITSTSTLTAKYGPDIANFVYGATTGDATEPVPTNTGSQAADAGIAFRNLFKKGEVILDFFGGNASRFKNGVSIDIAGDVSMGSFKGTIEQFAEIFKGTKVKQIVAENPYGSYEYLKAGAELLEQGGTLTVRGSSNNKFFNKVLDGTMEGLENFTVESKKLIEPIGKTTEGTPIKSKDYYEIILKRK
jgi:RHS repeat-associated protein